jgi:anti-sigma factor RsiW
MAVNCKKVAELLIDLVSGELGDEIRIHIEEHLHKCPPCVIYVETYKLTIKMTRQLPPVPMPPQLVERLKRAVETQRGQCDRPTA